VAGDHQTKNASAMVDEGASVLISEKGLKEALTDRVPLLLHDNEKLQKMSDAALKLAFLALVLKNEAMLKVRSGRQHISTIACDADLSLSGQKN
jgi:hypothetical protein